MAQWFRKVKAGLVKAEITEFIGEEGNIFFNVATGELRLSDGATPGGLPIGGGSGGPGTITVEENSVTKGSVTRLNFVNSTITVSGTTANITAPVGGGGGGGGGGSGSLNEVSTITEDGTFLDRVFLPDSIRFDNLAFTVSDIGNGDVKVALAGGLGNLDGGTHDTVYGGLDIIDAGGI